MSRVLQNMYLFKDSLSLSYQKKDYKAGLCQSFFWYDIDYTIYSVKAADYKSIVTTVPSYDMTATKNLKRHVFVAHDSNLGPFNAFLIFFIPL